MQYTQMERKERGREREREGGGIKNQRGRENEQRNRGRVSRGESGKGRRKRMSEHHQGLMLAVAAQSGNLQRSVCLDLGGGVTPFKYISILVPRCSGFSEADAQEDGERNRCRGSPSPPTPPQTPCIQDCLAPITDELANKPTAYIILHQSDF